MTDARPIRRCEHKKRDQEQCKNNAMPGRKFCYLASHCGDAPLESRAQNFFQNNPIWKVVVFIVTLVFGIPALYSYSTRLSVVPFSTVRPHEPMGTIFNVTNDGIFDLHNMTQECDLIMVKGRDGNEIGNTITAPMDYSLGDLPAGTTKSLSCEKIVKGLIGEASIVIAINYSSPLRHQPRTKRFPFQSEQADDGTWVWKAK
jgi:hypothetical protein